jgi:hypothetical protein
MQWTIKLEFTPESGETVSHEIGSITRREAKQNCHRRDLAEIPGK